MNEENDLNWITDSVQRARLIKYLKTGYQIVDNHLIKYNEDGSQLILLNYRNHLGIKEKPNDV